MSYTYRFAKDFSNLKNILINLDDDNYPYEMDNFFNPIQSWTGLNELDSSQAFTLYAEDSNGDIVATYAARQLNYTEYSNWMRDRTSTAGVTYHEANIPEGTAWYSSCQWTHIDHRNEGLGATMDAKKKLKIQELGGTINYANHRAALRDYHKNDLGYDSSIYQAFIPSGGLGGSGGDSDRHYYICYETLS